jgi:hypothetical protein
MTGRFAALIILFGCSSHSENVFPDGLSEREGGPDPMFEDTGPPARGPCVGLKCQQVACTNQKKTSISGTVYMPNGTLPAYNAVVYVPNAELDNISSGASCEQCGTSVSGAPIVTTLTNAGGRFKLDDVPAGKDIPLVVQLGKWRRKFILPSIAPCEENPVLGNTLRLPKKRSEGDLPRIAVTTGGCDPLACILPKIGIDPTEYGTNSASQDKVILYSGVGGEGPNGIAPATSLWTSVSELKKFDMVILSCECSEYNETKGAPAPAALEEFVDSGGRVFGSHYHYTWFRNLISSWQSTATWVNSLSGEPNLIDRTFPKGKALADWMQVVEPSQKYGEIPIAQATYNVAAVNSPTTRWLYSNYGGDTTHYLSFNAPVGVPASQQCGKAVYGGMHISAAGGSVDANFPNACTTTLSPQEKVLAFLLFDLASCIQEDANPPQPPPPQ